MSEDTTRLKLPFIAAAQAQKHVTHNEALLALDVLVQAAVLDRDMNIPPASPAKGDAYIVAATATGDWAGHEGDIAAWADGVWRFHAPAKGWRAWVADEDALYIHDGAAWTKFEPGVATVNPVPGGKLGINTSADATNRLAVKSDAVLFSHDDVSGSGSGDVQFKINKATAANTASLLFQTGWSGRAELGLAGDDDFHLKVSNDGTAWHEAIMVDSTTGSVAFPNSLIAESSVFNLMRDGGRFAGSPEPGGYYAYNFARPNWMVTTNGTTVTEHAKFINDSSSYGGAGDPLDADVKQLVDWIVNAPWRRYYPEFFVALIQHGSGTSSSLTFPEDGQDRHTSIYTAALMRPVSMTVSYYIKALDAPVGIPNYDTTDIYLDGQRKSGHFLIPADGNWHHVLSIEVGEFPMHYRYNYSSIRLYMQPSNKALMAFPAMLPGRIRLPSNVGQIPGTFAW